MGLSGPSCQVKISQVSSVFEYFHHFLPQSDSHPWLAWAGLARENFRLSLAEEQWEPSPPWIPKAIRS